MGPLLLAMQRRRNGAVVALYHRVSPEADLSYPPVPPATFERQIRFLKRHFRIVPLAEMLQRHGEGQPLGGFCSVTFDDGYWDFLEHAYPVLQREGVPVSHYLVSDCVLSGRPTWNLRLNRLVSRRSVGRDTASAELARLKSALSRMSAGERYAWLDEQEATLGERPSEPAMLCVADLRRVDPGCVEWGSHTVSHAALGECDPCTIRSELAESRRVLEELTGRPIRDAAYPNGSYTPAVCAAVQEQGYRCGLAVEQREVRRGGSPYALPRFDLGAAPAALFGLEVSGGVQALRNARARLRPAGFR